MVFIFLYNDKIEEILFDKTNFFVAMKCVFRLVNLNKIISYVLLLKCRLNNILDLN